MKLNKQALFLCGDSRENRIIAILENQGFQVTHTSEKIDSLANFDFIVSLGYRHLILEEVLDSAQVPIFNLHIGYLPYNRGSHPNFWSFADNTPSGITIHIMDKGIDTGPIAFQRNFVFDKKVETFETTYNYLVSQIIDLFDSKIQNLILGNFELVPQRGLGTFHKLSDLPESFSGWNANISEELGKLDKIFSEELNTKLQLIDQIEKQRSTNNLNWMNLLRVAFKYSPSETKIIVKKIQENDLRIFEFFKQLGD